MTSETRWLPVRRARDVAAAKEREVAYVSGDVLPLTVQRWTSGLPPPSRRALRAAVEASDTGYAMPAPELGGSICRLRPPTLVLERGPRGSRRFPDVGVGVVQLLRVLAHPGDAVVISPPVYPPFFEWASEHERGWLRRASGSEGWLATGLR